MQSQQHAAHDKHGAPEIVAPGIVRIPIIFVNAYLLGEPGGPWVLVDTGMPMSASHIRSVAEARFGTGARPEAIILTHGHFDHAGSAGALADAWDVPIYAHPLEMPYLTGRSDYPPRDPSTGGAIAQMSRMFPDSGYNFGGRMRELPSYGGVPGLPEWRWIHAPGHTAGHIALFREADRVLIAGDAFATMNLDSWVAMVTRPPELHRPSAPFTADWATTKESVQRLAALRPLVIAAGHGLPMSGPGVAGQLQHLADHLSPPSHGRYVRQPAITDENGVVSVPPPASDPVGIALAGAAVAGLVLFNRRRRRG
jgi:glyoxylase-like metal-dependent hydrolase (beta-lactamase superfamily II)